MNSVLGENLEGLHQRRNQRSAPQSAQKCVPQKKAALLNSVREENDSPCTMRNWNVDVLLQSPLQLGRTRYDRRHVHQLFRQLRLANCRSQGDVLRQDLGHFDNLLGIRERPKELQEIWQLLHHLRRRIIECRQRGDVDNLLHGAPLYPLLRPDVVEAVIPGAPELRHTVIIIKRKGSGEEDASRTSPCTASRTPRRPCPSSDLVRYGACTRTRPQRRSSVDTSNMHGGVALFAALRHRRVQLLQPPT